MAWIPPFARFLSVPLLCALVACQTGAAAPSDAPRSDRVAVSDGEIERLLALRVDQQKWATGIVVVIVTPEGRRTIAYGTTERGGGRSVDARTVFDIGSITKVFTGLLLTDMAQRGQVALDDPVSKCLASASTPVPAAPREMSLVDLATHTAGLPLRPDNLVSKDPQNPYAGYSDQALLDFVARVQQSQPVGTAYEYSNVGFGLLGLALSRCVGVPYEALVEQRITGPLGMADTRMALTADMAGRVATGHDNELRPVPHWDMGALAGAAGFRSTATDLAKFLEAVLGLHDSELRAAMDAMIATRRPGGMKPATHMALAWNLIDEGGQLIAWKNGSVGGFRTFLGYDPAARIGVIALANAQTSDGVDDIGLHILDPDRPVNLTIPKVRTEIAVAPEILDRYVGRYRYVENGIMTVTRDGAQLFIQPEGMPQRIPIFAESDTDFFLRIVDAQIRFELGPDGKVEAAVWLQAGQVDRGERVE